MTHGSSITGIMACDPGGVIGYDGTIPWYSPDDVAHFRHTVEGHTIIMGRKTYESLPATLLDSCPSIIFSRNPRTIPLKHSNSVVVSSLSEFLDLPIPSTRQFMIGGAEIAELFLQHRLLKSFILTIIHKPYHGDAVLSLDRFTSWHRKLLQQHQEYTIFEYSPPPVYPTDD